MNSQYDHLLLSSFKEWVNYSLLNEARAFRNISSGRLYEATDKRFKDYDVFTAPYHQWVYDSSISGANVPSGIYINNTFTPRGTDNLKIDYNYGRAIMDEGSNDGNIVAADYAVKEFNIYLTTKSERKIIFETAFQKRPIKKAATGGLDPESFVLPAIFIRPSITQNKPWAFGGLDLTTNKVRLVCFTENEFQKEGIKGFFRDKNKSAFCLLNGMANSPIDEYGDVKNGTPWTYTGALANDMVQINDVVASDLENDYLAQHQPDLYVSVIEFELIKSRYPRQ